MICLVNMFSPSIDCETAMDAFSTFALTPRTARTQSPEICVACHAIRFQGANVPNWRKAEATAVLTAELADAFVSDLVGRRRRIQAVHQHPLSRSLKPEHLLVLQRTHGRQCTELVMERGNAHSRCISKFFDMKRFREI